MEVGRITGCTRVCGKSQGFIGLPIRDEIIHCDVQGLVPVMISAWFPTPAELEALNAGAPVHVRIQGQLPPPMFVTTGDPPD